MKKQLLSNVKKNLSYYIIGFTLILSGLIILFVTKPWEINKQADTSLLSEEKPTVSSNHIVNNSIKLDKSGHVEYELGQLSGDFVTTLFNMSYRELGTDKAKENYKESITKGTVNEAYMMSDPETGKAYEFDKKKTAYTRDELNDFIINFILKNKVKSTAEFTPTSQTTITNGYLYYIGGNLEITFHSCDDLTNFASYFGFEDMELNKTYVIPIEVEIFEDYYEGFKVGQIFREFEFIELWGD